MSAVPKFDRMTAFLTSSDVGSDEESIWGIDPSGSSFFPVDPLPPSSEASMRTETPIGSIITAVAVLDTHMLRKPVAIMNPAMTRVERVPIARTVSSAIRRCRFHLCMAIAMRNPPMNRKMMLFPYWAPTSSTEMSWPNTGNAMSGTSAVAGMGMHSVIHQIPSSTATAAVSRALCSRSPGMTR